MRPVANTVNAGAPRAHSVRGTRRALLRVGLTLPALLTTRKLRAAEDLASPDALAPLGAPASLPDLAFTGLADGGHVKLSDFRGKPVVINFWATWCTPCVAELPELDRLAAEAAAHGVTVLAASADRGGAAIVGPFLNRHPAPHLRVVLDPKATAGDAASVAGYPTTLIIDATGHLRARLEGPARWGQALPRILALTG